MVPAAVGGVHGYGHINWNPLYTPLTMASGSKAVYAALGANSVVTVAKMGGFFATGSPAMLSESIHSAADVMNQSLLVLGMKTSAGRPTPDFPYGLAKDRFIWAMISAVGVFFLGCGVTVYHGVSSLLHPHESAGSPVIALGVLLFALVVEGWSFLVAVREVQAQAAGRPLRQFLGEMDDPLAAAVLLEDGAAVTGVILAMIGIGVSHLTGSPVFDSLASILIGLMLGVVAILLVRRNRELLLGAAPAGDLTAKIEALLEADPIVENIADIKATVFGSGAVRVAAEVDFDSRLLAQRRVDAMDLDAAWETVDGPAEFGAALTNFGEDLLDSMGAEVDRLEADIRAAAPSVAHVDLETD